MGIPPEEYEKEQQYIKENCEPEWIESPEGIIKILKYGRVICDEYQSYLNACFHEYDQLLYRRLDEFDHMIRDTETSDPLSFNRWLKYFIGNDE
jgi:hypothetical protein